MERYICIHGHFYQPPRENPWLEMIEVQDSAHPYHDWNERIDAECYAPNASARILDEQGRIIRIVSNYERISFDFGPTLLSWMEDHAPETYQAVLEADFESRRRFSGHGSALAQGYNHLIMPLASPRDRRTQVVWGIRDFESRFRRVPEGMWLPETAVDLDTLESMAEHGIKFTILAPHQARRYRRLKGGPWRDTGTGFNFRRPYLQRLPSGREIVIFFYDGPTSRAIAFEGLLNDGAGLAARLLSGLSDTEPGPQIMSVATDGETFGHHHRFGEMALAYALDKIESTGNTRLTNYGEYLERHPPAHEVEIHENTAWSCAHGIERWRSDCGCRVGRGPGWNQRWRAPLREALDWLRDYTLPLGNARLQRHLANPWRARDAYVSVILDRNRQHVAEFLQEHAHRPLDRDATVEILRLLELERHAMLMYTSCGWFFDDISGIETVQILQYAARVIQLAEQVFGERLESRFLQILGSSESNLPEFRNGRRVYAELVKPAAKGMPQIGAHFAIRSLVCRNSNETSFACYEFEPESFEAFQAGEADLTAGCGRLLSRITLEEERMAFVAFRTGGLKVGARCALKPAEHDLSKALEALKSEDLKTASAVRDAIAHHLPGKDYSLPSLSRDAQRHLLDCLLDSASSDAEATHRGLYEREVPLLRFLSELKQTPPLTLRVSAQLVLNADLRRAFSADTPDPDRIAAALSEVRRWRVELDVQSLVPAVTSALERVADGLFETPHDLDLLERLRRVGEVTNDLGLPIDRRRAQNLVYEIRSWVYPEIKVQTDRVHADQWLDRFGHLLAILGIAPPAE